MKIFFLSLRCLLSVVLFFSVTAAQAAGRIVSVGGDITEIVHALGAADKLVGIDESSTFPASIQTLPKVGYQRNLATEGILSLKPDLLLMTELAGPPAVIKQLQATGVPMLSLPVAYTLADLQHKVARLGEALNRPQQAQQLNKKIASDFAALQRLNSTQPLQGKLVFILNHGGGAPMVAGTGTAADAVIRLSGAQNAAGFSRYKPLTPEAMVNAAPDIILLSNITVQQLGGEEKIWTLPGISLTPAAREKNIIVMDAQSLLGFGPRIFQVAAELHQQIYQRMNTSPAVVTAAANTAPAKD